MSALELTQVCPTIARVFGTSAPESGFRIAPDEWLLIGDDATATLAGGDPNIVDFSSGFVCLEVAGYGWEEAFAYLSDLALPDERPVLVQGHIAEVPSKAIVSDDSLLLLVPPQFAHHVREEIVSLASAGFALQEVTVERAPA